MLRASLTSPAESHQLGIVFRLGQGPGILWLSVIGIVWASKQVELLTRHSWTIASLKITFSVVHVQQMCIPREMPQPIWMVGRKHLVLPCSINSYPQHVIVV